MRQVSEARNVLKTTLNGSLIFHPVELDGVAGYRFYGTGSYGSILTYSQASNDGGGGYPQPALFCPAIRVPLRATKVG